MKKDNSYTGSASLLTDFEICHNAKSMRAELALARLKKAGKFQSARDMQINIESSKGKGLSLFYLVWPDNVSCFLQVPLTTDSHIAVSDEQVMRDLYKQASNPVSRGKILIFSWPSPEVG